MKKLVCFSLCLLLSATLLLCGCDKQNELRHVTLNEVTRSVFYAPLYVAVSLGYFEDEGMELEIVTGGGSDKSMTALLSGSADIALLGMEAGIYVHQEGKENGAVPFAQLTQRAGNFLLAREEDPDFQWSDLKGHSIIGGRSGGMPQMILE